MSKIVNLVGQRFGRLVAVEQLKKPPRHDHYYRCICDCGNEKVVVGYSLTNGNCKSCGCYLRECSSLKARTHNLSKTHLYKIWAGIKNRTDKRRSSCVGNYRKLNIGICDEWKNDFVSFYNWSIENGYTDEKLPNGKYKWTVDRIDRYGDYCPDNCRWATLKQQMNNQTRNKLITYKGKTQTVAQWCDELNLRYNLVNGRLLDGWEVERAFFESSDKKRYFEYKGQLLNKHDISKMTGISVENISNRVNRKWDIERIINQPEIQAKKKKKEKK